MHKVYRKYLLMKYFINSLTIINLKSVIYLHKCHWNAFTSLVTWSPRSTRGQSRPRVQCTRLYVNRGRRPCPPYLTSWAYPLDKLRSPPKQLWDFVFSRIKVSSVWSSIGIRESMDTCGLENNYFFRLYCIANLNSVN